MVAHINAFWPATSFGAIEHFNGFTLLNLLGQHGLAGLLLLKQLPHSDVQGVTHAFPVDFINYNAERFFAAEKDEWNVGGKDNHEQSSEDEALPVRTVHLVLSVDVVDHVGLLVLDLLSEQKHAYHAQEGVEENHEQNRDIHRFLAVFVGLQPKRAVNREQVLGEGEGNQKHANGFHDFEEVGVGIWPLEVAGRYSRAFSELLCSKDAELQKHNEDENDDGHEQRDGHDVQLLQFLLHANWQHRQGKDDHPEDPRCEDMGEPIVVFVNAEDILAQGSHDFCEINKIHHDETQRI